MCVGCLQTDALSIDSSERDGDFYVMCLSVFLCVCVFLICIIVYLCVFTAEFGDIITYIYEYA